MLKEARLVRTMSLISSWEVAGSARLCTVTLHELFRATVERTFGGTQRVEHKSSTNLGPTLGPALGPLVGGFIVQTVSWRWTFYVTSIAAAGLLTLSVIFLSETYEPVLESRRQQRH